MKNLNEIQVKNLITGVKLAAELEVSKNDLRCFISVFAYQYNKQREFAEMSKFLKHIKEKEIFFTLRKYEISEEFIKNGWYPTDEDLINSIYIEDINGFENLEKELLKYISDLSILEPEWKCDIIY